MPSIGMSLLASLYLKMPLTSQRASSPTVTAQEISETAKEEGGPSKGSKSAKMQSELTKQIDARRGTAGGDDE